MCIILQLVHRVRVINNRFHTEVKLITHEGILSTINTVVPCRFFLPIFVRTKAVMMDEKDG